VLIILKMSIFPCLKHMEPPGHTMILNPKCDAALFSGLLTPWPPSTS
jgi:hypothetical protein